MLNEVKHLAKGEQAARLCGNARQFGLSVEKEGLLLLDRALTQVRV